MRDGIRAHSYRKEALSERSQPFSFLLLLGTTGGCVVRAWITPGVIDLILRTGVQYLFEEISIIRPTPCASVLRGREGRLLATLALEHDALWTPPVDLAYLHVFDFVARLDALDYLRHCIPLSPFLTHERAQQDTNIKARRPLLSILRYQVS